MTSFSDMSEAPLAAEPAWTSDEIGTARRERAKPAAGAGLRVCRRHFAEADNDN